MLMSLTTHQSTPQTSSEFPCIHCPQFMWRPIFIPRQILDGCWEIGSGLLPALDSPHNPIDNLCKKLKIASGPEEYIPSSALASKFFYPKKLKWLPISAHQKRLYALYYNRLTTRRLLHQTTASNRMHFLVCEIQLLHLISYFTNCTLPCSFADRLSHINRIRHR